MRLTAIGLRVRVRANAMQHHSYIIPSSDTSIIILALIVFNGSILYVSLRNVVLKLSYPLLQP